MRHLLLAGVCALLPFSVSAQTFEAENHLIVAPLGGASFEVIEARGEGPRGMWCAAADYAQRRLGQSNNARVYIQKPRGPAISAAGRKGVVFTTDPAALSVQPSQSLSLTLRQTGVGLPVHHAYQFCYDRFLERDDRPSIFIRP